MVAQDLYDCRSFTNFIQMQQCYPTFFYKVSTLTWTLFVISRQKLSCESKCPSFQSSSIQGQSVQNSSIQCLSVKSPSIQSKPQTMRPEPIPANASYLESWYLKHQKNLKLNSFQFFLFRIFFNPKIRMLSMTENFKWYWDFNKTSSV